jgi:uncharacterized protein YjiS (DUF1127 family)
MTNAFATTADFATSGHASKGVIERATAAVAAALARAKARHEYRRLLACDDILRDVGVSRDDVRRALMENGGRP